MKDPNSDNALITVEDVARYLKLKPQTIYKWAQEDQIPAIKLGKEWRFRKSLIDRWLDDKFAESGAVRRLEESENAKKAEGDDEN